MLNCFSVKLSSGRVSFVGLVPISRIPPPPRHYRWVAWDRRNSISLQCNHGRSAIWVRGVQFLDLVELYVSGALYDYQTVVGYSHRYPEVCDGSLLQQ